MNWTKIFIDSVIYNKIIDTCSESPNKESCGILIGKDLNKSVAIADEFHQMENITDGHAIIDYMMNPQQLMEQLKNTSFIKKDNNKDWVCIWHSHPNGVAVPSNIDLDRAEYNVIYLIYGMREDVVRCFGYDKEKNEFYQVEMEIV